jgi:DNA helicase-2/ATP-dependent DNA helicase PcrA
VVKFAHQWVSHIHAHESAPDGVVSSLTWDALVKNNGLSGSDAILCRNTKPLVSAAFALIRARIACRIEGREVGGQLKKLATRWNRVRTLNALDSKLHVYLEREKAKFLANRKEQKAQEVEDKVETLRVIIDQCRSEGKHDVADVETYIDSLFADNVSGILTLSTIHKSKGREWKRVFWLARKTTCPSPYARQSWQIEQENNLQYVAATRAMEELVDLEPPAPRVDGGH